MQSLSNHVPPFLYIRRAWTLYKKAPWQLSIMSAFLTALTFLPESIPIPEIAFVIGTFLYAISSAILYRYLAELRSHGKASWKNALPPMPSWKELPMPMDL